MLACPLGSGVCRNDVVCAGVRFRCRLATFFARVVGAACYEQSVGYAEQVVGDSTGAEPAVACDTRLGVDDAWVCRMVLIRGHA